MLTGMKARHHPIQDPAIEIIPYGRPVVHSTVGRPKHVMYPVRLVAGGSLAIVVSLMGSGLADAAPKELSGCSWTPIANDPRAAIHVCFKQADDLEYAGGVSKYVYQFRNVSTEKVKFLCKVVRASGSPTKVDENGLLEGGQLTSTVGAHMFSRGKPVIESCRVEYLSEAGKSGGTNTIDFPGPKPAPAVPPHR